jgi:hypothetical protein
MAFDEAKHPRDPTGKWTHLANAILKTASNLRDTAGVSQQGHDIYTKRAADHLEKAAYQIFAGDNQVAAGELQAAHDVLKKGHPHHRHLPAVTAHLSTHRKLVPSSYAGRAVNPGHEEFVTRTREMLNAAGIIWRT